MLANDVRGREGATCWSVATPVGRGVGKRGEAESATCGQEFV